MIRNLLSCFSLTSLIIMIGCESEPTATVIIEGRSLGIKDSPSMLTVFVEDNHAGNTLVNPHHNEVNLEEYSVEAYRVQLNNETTFIIEETEESFYLDFFDWNALYNNHHFMYLHDRSGRKVTVIVTEGYEQIRSTSRKNYILHSTEFLPILTAKEIRFSPLTYENFIIIQTRTGQDTVLMVTNLLDNDSNEIFDAFYIFWQELSRLTEDGHYISFTRMDEEQLKQYNMPNTIEIFPYFFIFDGKGIVKETANWDEVIQHFDPATSAYGGIKD